MSETLLLGVVVGACSVLLLHLARYLWLNHKAMKRERRQRLLPLFHDLQNHLAGFKEVSDEIVDVPGMGKSTMCVRTREDLEVVTFPHYARVLMGDREVLSIMVKDGEVVKYTCTKDSEIIEALVRLAVIDQVP